MSRMKIIPRTLLAATLAFALAAFSLVDPVSAQRGQWERLASKKVNMLADRDVIELDRRDGRFNALRFNATRGSINIYRIRVTFGNGETQDLDVSKKLREGEDTGAIDLSGRARVIDRIEMLYASSNLLKRAQLEVFGRVRPGTREERADDDRNDDRDKRPARRNRVDLADWKKLGQRHVDLDFDRDRIWVGLKEGRFDRILLRAKGGDIRLVDLKVVYGNGEVDDIRVRSNLRDGTTTRTLDLKGRHRGIRRIEMVYRQGKQRRLRPVLVEVFGRPAKKKQPTLAPEGDDAVDGQDDTFAGGAWAVLGSRDVDLSLDRDAIDVRRGDGPFDAVALRARGNAVEIYDIRITFGNGKRQTIRVDERLRPGRQSRTLDLKGAARRITKVEMLYKKARTRGRRATVEVLARRVERKAGGDTFTTAETNLPRGWSRIGDAAINRRSRDAVIEPRNARERYREIALRVSGGNIRLRSAEITFANGRKMRLRVNGAFRDGDSTDPIDLKGRGRRIERIELDFEPIRGRRDVTVEVIGKS